MPKPPRQLIKQVENFEAIIDTLNGLIDGSKIKLEYYDQDFLERLSTIRKDGLELRDKIQLFKNDLEHSLSDEYTNNGNSRFASEATEKDLEFARKVVNSFIMKDPSYE